RKPSTGAAWLLLILIMPILGFVIFLFFGRTELGRGRHERQLRAKDRIRQRTGSLSAADVPTDAPAALSSVVALNDRLGSMPLVADNGVQVVDDYDEVIRLMTEAVASAHSYVYVEFYIMAWDELTEPFFVALADAAERGVDVKVLF